MRVVFWLNGWLVRALSVLAVLVIVAMMIGISAEVALRVFSSRSIPGSIELTEYGLFISTFFVAPYLLRTNEHIRVDIVMSRVDPVTARRVEYGVLLTIIAISLVTAYVGSTVMLGSARDGTMIFKDLIFPQWWLDWVVPLTSAVMALQALEILGALYREPHPVTHQPSEHVPGLRPEELP